MAETSILFPALAPSPSSQAALSINIDLHRSCPCYARAQHLPGGRHSCPFRSCPVPTPGLRAQPSLQASFTGRLTQPRNAPGWASRSAWSSSLRVTRMETPAAAWSINTRHTVEKQKSIFRLFPSLARESSSPWAGWAAGGAGASVPHRPSLRLPACRANSVLIHYRVSSRLVAPRAAGGGGRPCRW